MTDIHAPFPPRPPWHYRLMMRVLGGLAHWVHAGCRPFIRGVSDSFERRLTPGERIRQRMHRTMCALCRTQERHLRQLRALAHEVASAPLEPAEPITADPTEAAPSELTAEAQARMRQALRERLDQAHASREP